MRTHLAVMFFRYALKSHIKGVMSRSSQGFNAGINLLQLTAERLFSIIDAAVRPGNSEAYILAYLR